MLGKLIRYEWKNTYKVGCLMLGVVALITFLGWLAFQTPLWAGAEHGYRGFGWLDIFSVLTLIMYVIMLVAVNYGILIYLAVHFYRTMYTDQGYLTHTLPVTKHQLLISKLLVSSLWVCFILLSIYLSIILLGLSMLSAVMPSGYSLASFWQEFSPEIREALYMMKEDLDLDLIRWLVSMLVMAVIGPFPTVMILFGSISLGQLFPKHRVLMAIVSYLVITVAVSLVTSLFQSVAAVTLYGSVGSYVNMSMDSGFLINLLAAIGLYFASWYVNARKLNLA